MQHYDLCVIGSGPGGQKAAIQAAKLGRDVCVIERMDVVGGVAINTGTIPSKALREAVLGLVTQAHRFPLRPRGLEKPVTIETLLRSCRLIIQQEILIVEGHLASNGVVLRHGAASFVDEHTIRIKSRQNDETITADKVVIGVGTVPARPAHIPFDGTYIITSDDILTLARLPRSTIVVGGGVIGTEYASMFTALGIRTTLIEGRSRLLDFIDAEIGEALQYQFRQAGATLRLGEKVVSIEKTTCPHTGKTLAQADLGSGKKIQAECLLYCVGRQGAIAELNLDAVGLAPDARGRIAVDERYRTSHPDIYAIGDVIGFPALASTSMDQGRVAACNIYGVEAKSLPELFPFGIYSIPEISFIGKNEELLTREAVPFEAGVAHYKEIARGQLVGDDAGKLKLLIHQKTHKILGVHIIGTGATELIHLGQMMMAFGGTAEYFIDAVFNYPTFAECYKVAAHNGLNKLRSL